VLNVKCSNGEFEVFACLREGNNARGTWRVVIYTIKAIAHFVVKALPIKSTGFPISQISGSSKILTSYSYFQNI